MTGKNGRLISCGQFARSQKDGVARATAVFQTHGRGARSPLGRAALEEAQARIGEAVADGRLPGDLIIDWRNDEQFSLSLACRDWDQAGEVARRWKITLPEWTGAEVNGTGLDIR